MTDLAARIARLSPEQRERVLQALDAQQRDAPMPRLERVPRASGDFPLSFAQERLWFLDRLSPGNAFYNITIAHRVSAGIDARRLDQALTALAARHEALRTVFDERDGEPVQRILPPAPARCAVVDLGDQPAEQRERDLERIASDEAQRPFDLASSPLYRAILVRLGPSESAFIFVVHHIVADSWSMEIILRDLGALYAGTAAPGDAGRGGEALQYVDYAVWQRTWLQGERLERQIDYWRRQLRGAGTVNLITDRPRPRVQTFRGGAVDVQIPAGTIRSLRDVERACGATRFMTLLTAFFVLLHRYTGQDDLSVGVPIANRTRAELEHIVGFLTNSLVMRADLSGNPSFRDALGRVRRMALDAYDHQDLPFSTLVAALRPEQDLSRNPLFQISFQLIACSPTAGPLPGRGLAFERGSAIFDIVLNLWETEGDEVRGLLEYNVDLFDRATIERMARVYRTLLSSLAAAPDLALGQVPMLTPAERRQMLVEWNATASPFPSDRCIHELFEAQAARTPGSVAVADARSTVTYAELNDHADSLATQLIDSGLAPRRRIGILLDPSSLMVGAVLAVLKAGNAYVPFDGSMPQERLRAMVDDANVDGVITTSALAGRLPEQAGTVLLADNAPPLPPRTTHVSVTADDLAYIIFTSGSTGRSKGVMVPHRAVVNYLTWCGRTYPVGEDGGAPLCSPLASDMSITSLFLPLCSGSRVVVLDAEEPVESLDAALRGPRRFDFVKLTPTHLDAMRHLSLGRDAPRNTGAFIVGGEALDGRTLALWRQHAPSLRLFNEYGPTETVVGCAVHGLSVGDVQDGAVPIGRPIANTRLYVLDRHGEPVPIGIPGELFIGGAGVALGYASAPALTAARFVPDPFASAPGARMYRSGDLVRHRPDGTLVYLGRVDRQLKIRGYRVEPGDVEAAIRLSPLVAEVAVGVRDVGLDDRQLAAYIVPAREPADPEGAAAMREQILTIIRRQVPRYMVPGVIRFVAAIPRTPSGKTDIALLESASAAGNTTRRASAPPETALERVIAATFQEVLKSGPVGKGEDFFSQLGGHSLLATKAIARLRERLRVDVPLRQLFDTATVDGLAQALSADPRVGKDAVLAAETLLEVMSMTDAQVLDELSAPPSPLARSDESFGADAPGT